MNRLMLLAMVATMFTMTGYTQADSDSEQLVFEVLYILPEKGMEDKFEAGISAHDLKYHPEGPYGVGMHKIMYGEKAGWYVWVMGPTTYGSLDTRPDKENGHMEDWKKNVDPYVAQYGYSGLWNFNSKLSYGMDILMKNKYFEHWGVDLKPNQYYRFKGIIGKLQKVYESLGTTAFIVVENTLHQADGPDVALMWSFNSFGDWQKDPGPKAEYEKLYGANSWQNMIDEWMDIIVDFDADIRVNIPAK